jgi:hypothetical protein
MKKSRFNDTIFLQICGVGQHPKFTAAANALNASLRHFVTKVLQFQKKNITAGVEQTFQMWQT